MLYDVIKGKLSYSFPGKLLCVINLVLLQIACISAPIDKRIHFRTLCENGNLPEIKKLISSQEKRAINECLYDASSFPEIIKFLITAGADVSSINYNFNSKTPLMHLITKDAKYVLSNNDYKSMKILVAAGANVNVHDNSGISALMWAAKEVKPEAVKLLLSAGAEINGKDKTNNTALAYASLAERYVPYYRKEHYETIKLLLAADADVNIKNRIGQTVLMSAANNYNLKITKMFLSAGADVNVVDQLGMTALIFSARGDDANPEVVKLLIKSGAKINHRDGYGKTALGRATNKKVKKILIKAGAKK